MGRAGRRELIQNPAGKFYAKRRQDGTFKEMDRVGPSLRADRRRAARRVVLPGFGDLGDQRRMRR